MSIWIFQGNPTRFNVDDYLLENESIWWSIRQQHLAEHIKLGDEVFIWRSDGGNKGSGGIVARTQVIKLPQDYTNDSTEYWYEDVSGETYLAVELKVLEVDLLNGINRLELKENENLANLKILKLKQNTNYLVADEHADYLRQLWYNRVPVNPENINTRFPLVTSIVDVIVNMKQFESDVEQFNKLYNQIPSFQQWYYIHAQELLAPSKFIGYQGMKGHMYLDKDAIAWTDGRATVNHLKKWFVQTDNPLLRKYVDQRLDGKSRKEYTINILKDEVNVINEVFSKVKVSSILDNKWLNEINESLKELGGSGILEDIYLTIQERNQIDLFAYVDWKSQIRKQIYLHSSDCVIFRGNRGDESDLFYSIEGKGKGYWGLRIFTPTNNNVSLTEDELSFEEGKRKLRTHLVRERNPKIIKLAKERFKEKHGKLFCEVCDFDFFEKYGELGEGFIEGHHTIPVSELVEGQSTKVDDIALVCSNCHKMLHRRRPWLNKTELKQLIQ